MPSRRLSRAEVDREHTYEWLMQREEAQTRRCPTCLVGAGQTCRNVHTGQPVTLWPAHLRRLRSRPSCSGTPPLGSGQGSPPSQPGASPVPAAAA